ncbi:MAG: Guanine nucleotide exchange factor lte1 [Bathelium mastoideum]|nr:MAG: Guanine nucleotide exchange factor lte1 [Bathelium mastoideum]
MADTISISLEPLPALDPAVANSPIAPSPPAPANPRRVANVVRQRRRKNFGSLRHAKDSTEQLRRVLGGNSGNATDAGPVVPADSESGARDRSATQYTVGNIASGRIYLRPVERNERSDRIPAQAPPFAPLTDSTSAAMAQDTQLHQTPDDRSRESFFTRTPISSTSPHHPHDMPVTRDDSQLPVVPRRKPSQRAHSFSTVDDHAQVQADSGTFRIVIERPSMTRPKTTDVNRLPLLDVQIPHYKLGTPRFSVRGTATLRSSAFTRNSDVDAIRSSIMSRRENDMLFPGVAHISLTSGPNSVVSPRPFFSRHSAVRNSVSTVQVSPPRIGQAPITPAIYDALTTNPDDPAFVRYNATTGQMTAATPARLVAHITSPSFLDYELLSDFFLTFRSYLSPADLVCYLVARLEWAVSHLDNFGRIVRVRTFVALRHWILNYFVDDFVPDRQLRIKVCYLVNRLYSDVKAREGPGGGDLKIIGELKKCWRRTCALYWEMPDTVGQPSLDDEILPGGESGNRNSKYSQQSLLPAINMGNPELQKALRGPADDFHDLLASKSAEAIHTLENVGMDHGGPVSVTTGPGSYEPEIPTSPYSEHSLQAKSCSIPVRAMPRNGYPQSPEVPLFPHPVHVTQTQTTITTAPTPQPVVVAQQAQSSSGHKRSGSFNDALRDERAGLSRQKTTDPRDLELEADLMASYPFTAGLIRGIVMQPVSPYIDDVVPLSPSVEKLELLDFDADVVGILSHSGRLTLAANPGVRRLLGSVRRALSNRHGQSPSRSDKSLKSNAAAASEGQLVPSNALTAPLSERRPKKKTQVRIDLLSAGVCESFRRAMIEEFEAEGQANDTESEMSAPTSVGPPRLPELADLVQPKPDIHRLDSNVTVGSRSIVIVDDTQLPPPIPHKSPYRHSTQVVDEALARQSAFVDPRRGVTSMATTIPDDGFGADLEDMRVADHVPRSPPFSDSQEPISGPTSETVPIVMPLDQPSPVRAAPQPVSPISPLIDERPNSLRRYSSLHKSFRFAERTSEDPSQSSIASPRPAHQLRRKPGGDLKAVSNVQQLGPIKRPRSTGSLTNASHSVTNSIIYSPTRRGSAGRVLSRNSKTMLSNKAFEKENEKGKAKGTGMVETHSPQHKMGPKGSFEKEIARLAQLEDDEEGDIGVALAKLEGKWERKSPIPQQEPFPKVAAPTRAFPKGPPPPVQIPPHGSPYASHGVASGGLVSPLSPRTDTQGASIYRMSQTTNNTYQTHRPGTAGKASVAETEDSYSSIPLLERGLSVHDKQKNAIGHLYAGQLPTNAPAVPVSPALPTSPTVLHQSTPDSSLEHVEETDSMRRIPRGGTMPLPRASRESFLLDSDEELSDLSSDLSTEIGDDFEDDRGIHSFYHHDTSDADAGAAQASHPLRFPPTPPLTGGLRMDDDGNPADMSGPSQQMHIRPPSPDPTPVSHYNPTSPMEETVTHHKDLTSLLGVPQPSAELQDLHNKQQSNPSQRTLTPQASQPHLPVPTPSSMQSPHVPFVLSYASDVLAQQFTIIERDALDELDWKELINLNFSNSDSASVGPNETPRDWVNYLRTQDPRGLALITARFNIVVKWAISEIILIPADPPLVSQNPPSSSHQYHAQSHSNDSLQNYQLRVATIRKYIHVALACRRLRNFATMAQLVIALTSGDVARLSRTWAGVPAAETAALADLERLVSPIGNFSRLRREMEGPALPTTSTTHTTATNMSSSSTTMPSSSSSSTSVASARTLAEEEQGTIPFVGVYTHDLIYNAQKPPYLPASTRIDGTSRGGAAHGAEGCSGEGLVNFERHHRAAGIVKNLLRLLESSGRYVVEMEKGSEAAAGAGAVPGGGKTSGSGTGKSAATGQGVLRVVPEALARCLWMGALTDREIAQLSRNIEP